MADEPGKTPAPRPRRRRSDIDPTFKPPKVANERRRSRATPPPAEPVEATAPPTEVATVDTPEVGPNVVAADDAPTVVAEVAAVSGDEVAESTGIPVESLGSDELAAVDVGRADAVEPREVAASVAMFGRPADGSTSDDRTPAVAAEAWLPMLEDRSPNPMICPFLRATDDGRIGPPIEEPDVANRCAALREAVPQSLRQQELVCLTSGHVNCPRYLRGAAAVTELPPPAVRPGKTLTPAILGSIVLLIGAFVLSVGFVASRGGMELTAVATGSPAASAPGLGEASPSASTDAEASEAVATPTPSTEPTPTPAATSSPTPTATPAPSPTPSPTPEPTPTPKPEPTSDRYDLLTECQDADDCWIYKVRSGDNLYSIARYFGVPLARVYAMNPWLESTGLKAGQSLRLPPPTR